MIRTFCCFLLLALASAGQAVAQTSDAENKLMVLEHVWNEAQVNRDAPVLDALVAETFTNTEYDGEVSDKAKFLADTKIAEAQRDYQTNVATYQATVNQ